MESHIRFSTNGLIIVCRVMLLQFSFMIRKFSAEFSFSIFGICLDLPNSILLVDRLKPYVKALKVVLGIDNENFT